MRASLCALTVLALSAGAALADTPAPGGLPSPGALALVAAIVVGAVYLARFRR